MLSHLEEFQIVMFPGGHGVQLLVEGAGVRQDPHRAGPGILRVLNQLLAARGKGQTEAHPATGGVRGGAF